MAVRLSGVPRCISDEIACGLQQIATDSGVPYLKLAGHDIIAAAGFEPAEQAAATLIADMALAIRDRCIAVFDENDRAHDFQIGGRLQCCDRWGSGQRASNLQSMGGCRAYCRDHGGLRTAGHRTGDRGRIQAAAPGFPVSTARQLLSAQRRRVTNFCAGGPIVSGEVWLAPQSTASHRSPRRVRRVLARIGRAVRSHTRFVLLLASLGAGVVLDGIRPTTWRRTVRGEFRRALRQAVGGGLSTTLVTAALIGLVMVSQALYWLGQAGQEGLIGPILVTVLVREVAPVLVGLIVMGRSGVVIVPRSAGCRSADKFMH